MECIISDQTTSYSMGSLDMAILSSTSTIRGDLVSTPTFVCMGLCVGFIPTSSA